MELFSLQGKMTDSEIASLVKYFFDPITAVAVVLAESGGNPLAKNTAGNTPPSTDRGLWQINSFYHAEVSDACAYDPVCSTKVALKLSLGGRNFYAWSAYKQGTYSKYLARAKASFTFVAYRVLVGAGETNQQALERQLTQRKVRFPITLCTRYGHTTYDSMPLQDTIAASGDYLVKYE